MRFTKMHGLGNDYVYVNGFAERLPADPAALAVAVSDRHFGIGGDGLILITPSEIADARMRMFNADGSEAEMCGNGVRCVAKYVYDHGLARKPELQIETGRGVLAFQLTLGPDGQVAKVRVNMGEPILDAAKIPTTIAASRVIDLVLNLTGPEFPPGWYEQCGLDARITCVSMGNPHVVLYCNDVAKVPLATVGPILETAAIFPRRINVHFVQKHTGGEVTMRTWERGSGITLACGTGACSVAVAGVLTGRTGPQLLAHLPGGDLELDWAGVGHPVFMTGPATEVFTGDWP
ncbi:MAG: diaminopimelate epimerase [Planctomycetaceae bacterium]|nr:diaminopimelate epimerase [Planctomycetaceae bacterium]